MAAECLCRRVARRYEAAKATQSRGEVCKPRCDGLADGGCSRRRRNRGCAGLEHACCIVVLSRTDRRRGGLFSSGWRSAAVPLFTPASRSGADRYRGSQQSQASAVGGWCARLPGCDDSAAPSHTSLHKTLPTSRTAAGCAVTRFLRLHPMRVHVSTPR
jgi:hypothetical protein